MSIVHVRWTGVLTLPSESVPRTANVCAPPASDEYDFGLVQAAKANPSILHSNVAVESGDVNLNVAVRVVTVPDGPPVIVTVGGVVSTVQE